MDQAPSAKFPPVGRHTKRIDEGQDRSTGECTRVTLGTNQNRMTSGQNFEARLSALKNFKVQNAAPRSTSGRETIEGGQFQVVKTPSLFLIKVCDPPCQIILV